MRLIAVALIVGSFVGAESGSVVKESTTISGIVRHAATQQPLAGATVFANGTADTTQTGADGRFLLRTSRETSLVGVRKDGFLAFQYPLLHLTTETLSAEIELRTDPAGRESYATASNLFFLCVIIDAPDRLMVRNHCGSFRPQMPEYRRWIVKHNPWNPYFGPAGDRGGVLIATKVRE